MEGEEGGLDTDYGQGVDADIDGDRIRVGVR